MSRVQLARKFVAVGPSGMTWKQNVKVYKDAMSYRIDTDLACLSNTDVGQGENLKAAYVKAAKWFSLVDVHIKHHLNQLGV